MTAPESVTAAAARRLQESLAEQAAAAARRVPPPIHPVAAAEVRGLRARLLTRLPAPVTLVCTARNGWGDRCRFIVTTSRPHWEAAQEAFCPAIDGDAWVCLTDAAERRTARLALEQWLVPGPVLGTPPPFHFAAGLHAALGMSEWRDRPTGELATAAAVTVGAVLDHFGATLLALDPAPEACVRADSRAF
jgi:hypothetical protein